MRVCLSNEGKSSWKSVHRLVAETFMPNLKNKPQVNHINGIKTDNNVQNLEWVTNKENCVHAVKNGLYKRKKHKNILQFSLNGQFIKEWETFSEVESELNIDKRLVWRCCHGLNGVKKAKNYIWKFKEEN